jgi:triphosphoribosyl-dephospho-CoA synthetase
VRTIATWLPASKQILEDFDGLKRSCESTLAYAVAEEFEDQLLFGSGSGENLTAWLRRRPIRYQLTRQ